MRFCFKALWSGGGAVGWLINLVGTTQLIYGISVSEPSEITLKIPWYITVIIGLCFVLVFSLRKANAMNKQALYEANVEAEREYHTLTQKIRQLSMKSQIGSTSPLLINVEVTSDDISLADIYTEFPKDKNNSVYPAISFSGGFIHIRNESQEPIELEIEYEITGGNVPVFLRNRIDNLPIFSSGKLHRIDTVNPLERRDVCFVIHGQVDWFHRGFKIPSYSNSIGKKVGYRIEGRIAVYRYVKNRMTGVKIPYIDIKLRVIASSSLNVSKFIEQIIEYRVIMNPETNKISLTPIEEIKK